MKIGNILSFVLIFGFIWLLMAEPQYCKEGAIRGILLCGRVIIPSLFPFTMCVLFISNSGVLNKFEKFSLLTNRLFGISAKEFSFYLLSLTGGYPVGAKLLNEAVLKGEISRKRAEIMLNFCINAGPAFIISAVGNGILGSNKVGIILLAGHIASSLLLCFFTRFLYPSKTQGKREEIKPLSFAENFVLSTSSAASTVFSICGFVILFSCINSYIEKEVSLKPLLFVLEITSGITYTNNIYFISFLLGLGGICIWCQVMAAAKDIKFNFLKFLGYRVLHGLLSCFFTALLVKILRIYLPTVSNTERFPKALLYSSPQLALSMFMMAIIFIISIQTKKYAGKMMEDMV